MRKYVIRSAAQIALVLLICGVLYYNIVSRRLIFILPSGYTGLISVVQSASVGDQGKKISFSLRGTIVRVPSNGIVESDSLEMFRRLSIFSAEYGDGRKLNAHFMKSKHAGEVAFWVMNAPATQKLYYYVGSHDEMAQFARENEYRLYSAP